MVAQAVDHHIGLSVPFRRRNFETKAVIAEILHRNNLYTVDDVARSLIPTPVLVLQAEKTVVDNRRKSASKLLVCCSCCSKRPEAGKRKQGDHYQTDTPTVPPTASVSPQIREFSGGERESEASELVQLTRHLTATPGKKPVNLDGANSHLTADPVDNSLVSRESTKVQFCYNTDVDSVGVANMVASSLRARCLNVEQSSVQETGRIEPGDKLLLLLSPGALLNESIVLTIRSAILKGVKFEVIQHGWEFGGAEHNKAVADEPLLMRMFVEKEFIPFRSPSRTNESGVSICLQHEYNAMIAELVRRMATRLLV